MTARCEAWRSALLAMIGFGLVTTVSSASQFTCLDACRLFQHSCARLQFRELRACRAGCAFDPTPRRCRDDCPDPREVIVSECRELGGKCLEACAMVGAGPCPRSCGMEARECLRADASTAETCIGNCRGPREAAKFECLLGYLYDRESGIVHCVRDAPVCIGTARAAYVDCRIACPARPRSQRQSCRRLCKREYVLVRRACLARPESGILACLGGCASAAGAFVDGPYLR